MFNRQNGMPPKRDSKAKFAAAFKQTLKNLKEIKTGSWFAELIKRVLHQHASTVSGTYFKNKYPALDNERIAHRLISTAAQAAGVSGGAAATAVSAAELAAPESGGTSLSVAATAFAGEVMGTTYIQLRMVYDISVIFDAPFDLNDPEDIMSLFWYAFGVNKWEDAANAFLKGGPRTAEYLGRKVLRTGLRRGIQEIVKRFGGTKLARKITERALLKLIVPGVNIPIAYGLNRWFTTKLGRLTIRHVKRRAACLQSFFPLRKALRTDQLNA